MAGLGVISSLLAFWLSAHVHTIYIIYNIIFQLYTGKKGLPLMYGQVTIPYQQHMNCYQTSTIYTSIYQYIIFGTLVRTLRSSRGHLMNKHNHLFYYVPGSHSNNKVDVANHGNVAGIFWTPFSKWPASKLVILHFRL